MSVAICARMAIALALPTLAAGAWLRRVGVGPHGIVGRSALGFVLGAAMGSLTFTGWRALGGTSNVTYALFDGLIFTVLLIAAVAGPNSPVTIKPSRASSMVERTAQVVATVSASLAVAGWVIASRTAPLGDWDAWAMWNARARFLFLAPTTREAFWFPPVLHPDYPLLLPASVARLFTYAGGVTTAAPAMLAVAFALATAALLWAALQRSGGVPAAAATLLLLGTSTWLDAARSQYADVPLAAFVLAFAVLLADASPTRDAARCLASAAFAGFCAGAAFWTKNEGALYLCAIGATWFLAGGWKAPRLAAAGALVAGSAAPLFATALHKFAQPGQNDILAAQGASALSRLMDPARIAVVATAFGRGIVALGDGVVFGALVVSLVLATSGSPRRLRWPLAAVGLALVGFATVFLLTPHPLEWHLATALHRLLVQCWPLALYALFYREPAAANAPESPAAAVVSASAGSLAAPTA